jgi:hypothetical protein
LNLKLNVTMFLKKKIAPTKYKLNQIAVLIIPDMDNTVWFLNPVVMFATCFYKSMFYHQPNALHLKKTYIRFP